MPVVVDASVTMTWCFEDESTAGTDAVLDRLRSDVAVVPPIWPLEVANVVLVAERRGRLTEAQAARFVELVTQLPIEVEDVASIAGTVAAGRRHGLTAYDASYLLLAERLGAPLATLNRALAAAARSAGVEVLADA